MSLMSMEFEERPFTITRAVLGSSQLRSTARIFGCEMTERNLVARRSVLTLSNAPETSEQ
eukprot:7062189-Alexandrium_andersonii.AAC.1